MDPRERTRLPSPPDLICPDVRERQYTVARVCSLLVFFYNANDDRTLDARFGRAGALRKLC